MKLKTKPLKWWQGLLIAIGGVLLAIGGVFLYVYFTSGIGPQKVYPDAISFETTDENGETFKEYNAELGQYELSGDFSMKIGTSTEGANQLGLTLSFTNNFTETPVENEGQFYITNGIIRIPYTVKIGEAFTIQVLTDNNSEIIGGISNIFAMTENKIVLPASAKIAIDVPVTSITPVLTSIDKNAIIEPNEKEHETNDISFDVIQGTKVDVSAAFNPERSQYIFSDEKSDRAESEWRQKDYFIEVIAGGSNFSMNRDDEGIYFSAVGALGSTARIKLYAFKHSSDQLNFYSRMEIADTGLTVEQYNNAIAELKTNSELAEVVEANITIVEAEVSDFKIARTERIDLKSNKKYTISASSSENADYTLGASILDKLGESVPAMISKIAARVLVKNGDNWVETNEVRLDGGNETTIKVNEAERHYTFINSSGRDLASSNWVISSSSDKKVYKMEVVLLMTNTDGDSASNPYTIYGGKEFSFEVSFNENTEAQVSWNTDETELSMIVFTGNGQSTQYQKQLSEMISVPEGNVYTKVVYFAYSDTFTEGNYSSYFASGAVEAFDKYAFESEEEKDYVVLSSSYLLFTKGIKGLKVKFATVKTDAYGKVLKDSSGKYQIQKYSTDLTIDALEKIEGLSESKAEIDATNCSVVNLVQPEGQTKYVIDRNKEIKLKINLEDEDKAALFLAQKDKMTIKAVSKGVDVDPALYSYSAPVLDGTIITYTVTFKPTFEVGDGTTDNPGKEVTFKLLYHPTENVIHNEELEIKFKTVAEGAEKNGCEFLTIYNSRPNEVEVEGLKNEYQVNIETSSGSSVINIEGQGADDFIYNLLGPNGSNIKVSDGFGVDITEESTVNLTSSNRNLLEINDKQVSFKAGITNQSSDVSLIISSGSAQKVVNFTFSSEKVTKIEYLDSSVDANLKKDNNVVFLDETEKVSETANLTSVEIRKIGYSGNEITLSKLVKVYVGDPEAPDATTKFKDYTGDLTFKLRNIAGMGDDNKSFIVGGETTSMLQLTGRNSEDTDDKTLSGNEITSETKITSINVRNNFGIDYPLELRIEGVGISIDLNLVFTNNTTGVVTLPTKYKQGTDKQVNKPEDRTDAEGIVYTGVFAEYPIGLGGNVKNVYVKGKTTPQPISWATASVSSDSGITITVNKENKNLTFSQVYEPTDISFTLYEIAGNKYAFYQTFNVCVYPNIKFRLERPTLNYTDVADGSTQKIDDYFTLKQYVYEAAAPISGLNYEISGVDTHFPVGIESTSGETSITYNFKRKDGEILNLSYGELAKDFTVVVKKDSKVICDYAGNAIEKQMSLALGFNYENLSALNSTYMEKVRYDGSDVILFKYIAEPVTLVKLLTAPSEPSASSISSYSFDLVGNEMPSLFTKTDDWQFQVVAPSELIAVGRGYYMPLAMYNTDTTGKITGDPIAYVRIPLVITQVNSIFAYYNNYNKTKENFDLETLLTQAEDYANFPMDIYAEKKAGASYQVIFDFKDVYTVAKDATLSLNGKTYSWKVEGTEPKQTLTLTSTEATSTTVTSVGNKITFAISEGVNVEYTWEMSGENLKLTRAGSPEGIYNTTGYISKLSVIAEQVQVKISGSELNGKVVGKNLSLKLVKDGTHISSSFDKITVGGTSYIWSLDEKNKLVLLGSSGETIKESDGKITISGTEYSIAYYTLRDAQDSGLIQITNENGNSITIKSLANEDRYVIIQMLSTMNSKSYIVLYRLKVTSNIKLKVNYPYGGNVEYLDVDGSLTKDLAANENNVTRFVVEGGNATAFNSIKSIIRNDGTEYLIGGVYNIKETVTATERKYTAGGFITIIFKGDEMTIEMSKDEKNVKVVMQREYENVVNGVRDYTFYLNVSSSEYIIEFTKDDIATKVEYKGSADIDLNPAGEQTFTVETLRQTGNTISSVGENIITTISAGKVGTVGEDELVLKDTTSPTTKINKTYSLVKGTAETQIATLEYDHKNKTLKITPVDTYSFTTETTFSLVFTATETRNEETISIQSGIATLNFTFGRTIKIEENGSELYGGMTYDFVGAAGLVRKVEKYEAEASTYKYTDITNESSAYSISVKCFEKGTDEKYETVTTKVTVTVADSKITTAMLKEDVDVKFEVKITVESKDYTFNIYKTLHKNVTYVNNTDLSENKDDAYTLNLTSEVTAGSTKTIDFADYLKLEDASITLPQGTVLSSEKGFTVTPVGSSATHYIVSYTSNGKTFTATILAADLESIEPETSQKTYKLARATTLFTTTIAGGAFSLEMVNSTNKSGTDPVTLLTDTSVGKVEIDQKTGKLTITPANVAVAQSCAYAIKIKYTFGSGTTPYNYLFYINIRMTVNPNTKSTVNYPVIAGTALEYETVGTNEVYDKNSTYTDTEIDTNGDYKVISKTVATVNTSDINSSEDIKAGSIVKLKRDSTSPKISTTDELYVYKVEESEPKICVAKVSDMAIVHKDQIGIDNKLANITSLRSMNFGDIINNFFKLKSDLAAAQRVVFSRAEESTISIDTYTASIIKAEDVLWYQNGRSVVLTLANGKSSGTVTFRVTCNAVSAEYEIYLIAGSVYTVNKHYTVGATEKDGETIDGISRDQLDTKTIFENDRLIALSIPEGIDSSLNDKIVNIKYNYIDGENKTKSKTIQFKLNTGKRGLTIYVEAGRKVDSIESVMIDGTTTELKDTWKAVTTQRITVSYATKLSPIEIDKGKVAGSVTKKTSVSEGTTEPEGAFSSYSIQSLGEIDKVYTATFSLGIGENSSAMADQKYKFQQLFDIDVDYDYRKGDVAITVTAHDQKDLVSLAGIRHPSTGILLSKDNISNAKLTLTVLSPVGSANDYWKNTMGDNNPLTVSSTYSTYKNLIDATFNKMLGTNPVKFLNYTDMKNDADEIYNYNLYGEGAANNGSFVLLKFTYTVDDTTKNFYIWTRILPDYEVKVGGNSITTEVSDGGTFSSTSENSANPYEVNIRTESNGTASNPAYSLKLASNAAGSILTIRNKTTDSSTGSSDQAISWTYKMTCNEDESAIKYNTNLDKLYTKANNAIHRGDDSNPHELTSTTADGKTSIVISQDAENVFGTKKYKVVVTNQYGYVVNFYFDIKPKNMRDPVIHSSSTLETITEGKTFDIGAVYDKVTITKPEKSKKYEVAVETKYPTGENIINIEGIDAWGVIAGNGVTSSINIKENDTENDYINSTEFSSVAKYFDSNTMLLKYVTIKQIDFLYGQNQVEVGSVIPASDNQKNMLATEGNLNLWTTTEDENKNPTEIKVEPKNSATWNPRTTSNDNITVPKLEEWIYSDSALSSTSQDSARVTMRIILSFGKATVVSSLFDDGDPAKTISAGTVVTVAQNDDDKYTVIYGEIVITGVNATSLNNIQTETYQLTKEITVTRQVSIDKSKQAVVRDGEAFELDKTFCSQKYFYATDSNDSSDSTKTISAYIDDTLAISLPAAQGRVQNLTIGIEVKDNERKTKAKGEISVQNSGGSVATIYRSISSSLTAWDGKEVPGKGYLIQAGDKLSLTFSNFDNNNTIEVGNNDYRKFYVTYGLSSTPETTPTTHSVANTWTVQYKTSAEINYNNGTYSTEKTNPNVLSDTNVKIVGWEKSGENYVATIVANGVTIKDVPQDKLGVGYPTGTLNYSLSKDLYYTTSGTDKVFSTIGDDNTKKPAGTSITSLTRTGLATYTVNVGDSNITNVPESYISTSVTVETTVATQSYDRINIPSSGQFSQTKMPEVEKSYIVKVDMGSGVTPQYRSYRVVKNWIVTPYYYRANGLSSGDDISESVEVAVNKSIAAVEITDETNTIPAGSEVTIFKGTADGTYKVTYRSIAIDNVASNKLKYIVSFNDATETGTVPLSAWANGVKWAEGKGSTNVPEVSGSYSSIAINGLNIMIGNPGQAGTATVDSTGQVTTRPGYPLGGNEYILLVIKVKASGIDGSFSVANDNTDYKLGNLRLFVTGIIATVEPTTGATDSVTIRFSTTDGTYKATVAKNDLIYSGEITNGAKVIVKENANLTYVSFTRTISKDSVVDGEYKEDKIILTTTCDDNKLYIHELKEDEYSNLINQSVDKGNWQFYNKIVFDNINSFGEDDSNTGNIKIEYTQNEEAKTLTYDKSKGRFNLKTNSIILSLSDTKQINSGTLISKFENGKWLFKATIDDVDYYSVINDQSGYSADQETSLEDEVTAYKRLNISDSAYLQYVGLYNNITGYIKLSYGGKEVITNFSNISSIAIPDTETGGSITNILNNYVTKELLADHTIDTITETDGMLTILYNKLEGEENPKSETISKNNTKFSLKNGEYLLKNTTKPSTTAKVKEVLSEESKYVLEFDEEGVKFVATVSESEIIFAEGITTAAVGDEVTLNRETTFYKVVSIAGENLDLESISEDGKKITLKYEDDLIETSVLNIEKYHLYVGIVITGVEDAQFKVKVTYNGSETEAIYTLSDLNGAKFKHTLPKEMDFTYNF